MQEQITEETFECIRRSFAMVSLAIASAMSRDQIKTLPSEFRTAALPKDIGHKLRDRVAQGDVTCIVADPEPFLWIFLKVGAHELRSIYGIWVGRPASWRGKVDLSKLPRMGMTPEEAEAKGIPVPSIGG